MKYSYSIFLKLIITLAAGLAAHPGNADTLTIPAPQKAAEAAFDNLPIRGLTQAQVRQELGEPEQINAPVGEPPISSWEYPDFIVYFERNRVLHTVLRPLQSTGE